MTMRLPWACALALTAACQHDGPPVSIWRAPGLGRPPAVALSEVHLDDPVAVERYIEALLAVAAGDEGLDAVVSIAKRMDAADLARHRGARLLAMQAAFRIVRSGGLGSRFDDLRALVDGLQAAAPASPEALACRSFLRWIVVTDGHGGFKRDGLDPAIVRELARDLRTLVDAHPGFDAPPPFDRVRMRAEAAAAETITRTLDAADQNPALPAP
ncbi:MAG: hypothetical protein EXR79_00685 [Myxococcales bacterium]|nr:hypothetical protein [Myxococcales bacterium]